MTTVGKSGGGVWGACSFKTFFIQDFEDKSFNNLSTISAFEVRDNKTCQ